MSGDPFKAVPDPLIGRTLDGRYEVLGRLGEGGVGVVYRARQSQLGRFVAIKVLQEDAAALPEWRQRFEREARALSARAHPNVVPVTDSGIDRGVPYLVMELLEGQTLGELIKKGPLPLWRAVDIARQTLRGLAFAHSKSIIHRDLKPTNVFLQALPDQADHVRLLDFGMVKFLEGFGSRTMTDALTRVGAVFGTPAYMSPEMVKGLPVDARSDVYSAGVLLFELLAGRRPFTADSYEGYMGAHLTQPVPSLAKLRPALVAAASFQTVTERALAKKPAARFKDAGVMLEALEAVIAKLPASAMRAGRAEARPKPTPRAGSPSVSLSRPRSHLWRHVVILVAFVAGIAAVETHLRRGRTRPAEIAAHPSEPPPKPAPQPAVVAEAPPPPVVAAPAPPKPAPAEAKQPEPKQPEPKQAEAKQAEAKQAEAKQPEVEAVQPKSAPPVVETPEARSAPTASSGARNPWQEPVPRPLRPIHDRLEHGVHMSQKALKPVYTYAHQNPDDPRPWLLLGRAYAELDWYSDAVDRYRRAYGVDSTSRGDPQMLADLLKAAAHPVAGRGAAKAVHDIYGAEAIPALDGAIERRASDHDAAARLTRLRESLAR